MNRTIKQLWIDALRSGDYEQGTQQLRFAGRFCVLGVLCNLHAQAHPRFAATQHEPSRYDGHATRAPERVLKWAGLTRSQARTLTTLNDAGRTFAELANLIENRF